MVDLHQPHPDHDPLDEAAQQFWFTKLHRARWVLDGILQANRLMEQGYDAGQLVWFVSRKQIPAPFQISGSRIYDVELVRVPLGTPCAIGIRLEESS